MMQGTMSLKIKKLKRIFRGEDSTPRLTWDHGKCTSIEEKS